MYLKLKNGSQFKNVCANICIGWVINYWVKFIVHIEVSLIETLVHFKHMSIFPRCVWKSLNYILTSLTSYIEKYISF